jgi:hypothetical protein
MVAGLYGVTQQQQQLVVGGNNLPSEPQEEG